MGFIYKSRAALYRRLGSTLSTDAVVATSGRLTISSRVGAIPSLTLLWRKSFVRLIVLFLPTLLAAVYFLAIATHQYESEARFVVRSAARPESSGGIAFLVQLGLARSQDDSFIVHDFLSSRDAIRKLQKLLPLEAMFNREGADFLARYPSLIYGPEAEEFYRYFQRMVTVVHIDKTGISTLRVRAFRPEDAQQIAERLLELGEDLVNQINQRLHTDSVGNSLSELRTAQTRVIDSQAALTEYRNRELTVDPTRNAVALADLISRLSAELGVTQAQIVEMKSGSGASPQLPALQRRAAALDEQITREKSRIAGDKDGLAARIAAYERLTLEREFASRTLSAAEAELVRAKAEATRQLLYLERVVEPNLADYPVYPRRIRATVTVFAANFLLVLIFWLVWSGHREHADRA